MSELIIDSASLKSLCHRNVEEDGDVLPANTAFNVHKLIRAKCRSEEMGCGSACISHRPVEPGVLVDSISEYDAFLCSHVSEAPREGLAADQAAKASTVCPDALGIQQQGPLRWGKKGALRAREL